MLAVNCSIVLMNRNKNRSAKVFPGLQYILFYLPYFQRDQSWGEIVAPLKSSDILIANTTAGVNADTNRFKAMEHRESSVQQHQWHVIRLPRNDTWPHMK